MGRPSKTMISHENAVQAALDVIDEEGLAKFSLERVARKLGVKSPSLYYHFANKSEILSEVALYVLRDIEPVVVDGNRWEETLTELCVAARRGLLKHPNATALLLEYFPRHIFVQAYDFWTGQCPYPPELQLVILDGTEKLTYGSALFSAASKAHDIPTMPDFDTAEFPNLAKAVAANPYDDDEIFAETIRAYLAGFRPEKRKAKAPKR